MFNGRAPGLSWRLSHVHWEYWGFRFWCRIDACWAFCFLVVFRPPVPLITGSGLFSFSPVRSVGLCILFVGSVVRYTFMFVIVTSWGIGPFIIVKITKDVVFFAVFPFPWGSIFVRVFTEWSMRSGYRLCLRRGPWAASGATYLSKARDQLSQFGTLSM